MRHVTVRVSEYHIQSLDRLVNKGIFHKRSEAIRAAIRMLVNSYRRELNEA